jgi:hypothetical protein
MKLLKHISDFFFSLRTTLWLLGIMLLLMLAGAFVMPGNKAFQGLHSTPLFEWIGNQSLKTTWWLWGTIGVLAVMALNTLFCSIESIVKKRKVTQWLLLISPQIIHIGFLFILLAHLLSGIGAYQQATPAREGTALKLSGTDTVLRVKDINIRLDYYGYISDWAVTIEYRTGDKVLQEDIIKPNAPSTFQGLNVNVKNLKPYPESVLLQLNREPGAFWALVGGIVFMIGIVTLIGLKIRIEK